MLTKLNSFLRALIVITGALALIFTLTGGNDQNKTQDEGFLTKEFDDIW